jgi:RNA polymerase-binding transcription factor DksA
MLVKIKNYLKKDFSKSTADNLAIFVGDITQDSVDDDIELFDSKFAIRLMSNEEEARTEINEAIQRICDRISSIWELTGQPIELQ